MKKRYGLLLFIASLGLVVVGCMMLVSNRQNAANQAKQIVMADQAGNNTETDMLKLKTYVASHMKVNVEFTLMGSYDRAVAAAKAKSNASNAMYAAAQASCDRRGVDSIRQSQCVAQYIAQNGTPTTEVQLPDVADYTYHYIGPAWTFDIAGLLILLGMVGCVAAVVVVVHRVVTK